jgi:RecA/RadA recombinase
VKKPKSKSVFDIVHDRLAALQAKASSLGVFDHARSEENSPSFTRYAVFTGIRSFDDVVGGMPIGKSVELCGLPKSGKTAMAVRTCVRAQQGFVYERIQEPDGSIRLEQLPPDTFDVHVLYYDNENSLSDFSHRRVDGTVMKGEILQCNTIELVWFTMEQVINTLEKIEEETGVTQFLIVVLDTIGVMTTKMDLDAAWGKMDYPRVPSQIKQGFRTMLQRMQRENVLLIGLNHVSRKMTADFRGRVAYKSWAYDSPGGSSFGYFSTCQIYFEMLQKSYKLHPESREADGQLVYFMTSKNRMMPPLRQGRLALHFTIFDREHRLVREGGFKDEWSILETLIYHKAAQLNDEGAILFRFEKFGVETRTFGKAEAMPSLEEQDDGEPPPPRRGHPRHHAAVRKREPKISYRHAWLEFYAQHQEDFDALYNNVIERALLGSEIQFPERNGELVPEESDDEDEEE